MFKALARLFQTLTSAEASPPADGFRDKANYVLDKNKDLYRALSSADETPPAFSYETPYSVLEEGQDWREEMWVPTLSGRFYPFRTDPGPVSLKDVARSLSHQTRWLGRTGSLYSVGQHSVLCARMARTHYGASREVQFQCLIHDATEAFLGDIPSQIKRILPDYRALEEKVLAYLCEVWNVKTPFDPLVNIVDERMAKTEARDLGTKFVKACAMDGFVEHGPSGPFPETADPWSRDQTYVAWLQDFEILSPVSIKINQNEYERMAQDFMTE